AGEAEADDRAADLTVLHLRDRLFVEDERVLLLTVFGAAAGDVQVAARDDHLALGEGDAQRIVVPQAQGAYGQGVGGGGTRGVVAGLRGPRGPRGVEAAGHRVARQDGDAAD